MTTNANENTYEFTITMTQAEVDEAMKTLDHIMRDSFEFGRMKGGETDYSFNDEELRLMVGAFHTLGERLPMRTYEFMEWAEARDEIDYAVEFVGDYLQKNSKDLFDRIGVDAVEKEIATYRLREKTRQDLEETRDPVWLKYDAAAAHAFPGRMDVAVTEADVEALHAARDELDAVIEARMKLAA